MPLVCVGIEHVGLGLTDGAVGSAGTTNTNTSGSGKRTANVNDAVARSIWS